MNKYLAHFCTICRHKWIVFKLMYKCGYPWQGLMHDMSKFSPVEFFSSARYFQGNKSPIEAEKAALGYSLAWAHHKGHNPHHWEYWVDFDGNGDPQPYAIPHRYVIEMVCDYVAAGMVYSKKEWTQDEPFEYFKQHEFERHYHPFTKMVLQGFLYTIKRVGIENFCRFVRDPYKWSLED